MKPESVEIVTAVKSMSVGKSYKLQCKSYGSVPPAEIHWWKSGEKLKHAKEFVSELYILYIDL